MGDNHLFHVTVVGNDTLNDHAIKALVRGNFNALLKFGCLVEPEDGQVLDWIAFSVHKPMPAHATPRNV